MQKSQGRVTDEQRNAHHLPLHICMCIYRCRYIDIYSHKHMHLYAGRICSRSGREGSDCLSPVDSHPPPPQLPTKHVPAITPRHRAGHCKLQLKSLQTRSSGSRRNTLQPPAPLLALGLGGDPCREKAWLEEMISSAR